MFSLHLFSYFVFLEFKRRKDLVFKYRKDSNTSLSFRLSKFTLHTMKKKSSRLGIRITSTFRLANATKDEEFEARVYKFRTLEKTIKIFLRDSNAYMEQMKEFVDTLFHVSEDIA